VNTSIVNNLRKIQKDITAHEHSAQRDSASVALLAVSKRKPAADIVAAYDAGQREFGESFVQEALEKISVLRNVRPDIVWHFIGRMQSNKIKMVAAEFDWVQTVASIKIAEKLNMHRPKDLPPLNVCIQVNISEEPHKAGVAYGAVFDLANYISNCSHLTFRGVMAMGLANADEASLAQMFGHLSDIYGKLKLAFPSVDTLSLGMSHDMRAAINSGSTMVRIGTALFGVRDE
jgi:PLP dependent protein